MESNVVIAILSLVGTLLGTFGGIMAANKLSNYRISELEKKVEKHNNVVERTYKIERDSQTAFRLIDETKANIKEVKDELKDFENECREHVWHSNKDEVGK